MIATAAPEFTGEVVIEAVAVVLPCATVTLAGSLAMLGTALLSETFAPPAGAALVRTTVAFDDVPPTTALGASVTRERLFAVADGVEVVVVVVVVVVGPEGAPAKLPCGVEGCELLPQPTRQNVAAINGNKNFAQEYLRRATRQPRRNGLWTHEAAGLESLSHGRGSEGKRPEVHVTRWTA